MKVAHLAEFAPNQSGLYGTTRDMVMAERLVGVDAVFVDSKIVKNKVIARPNLKDGDLPIRDVAWAKKADILVHHSIVHTELQKLGIPIVLVMHGRPESTFVLEHRRQATIYGLPMAHEKDSAYKAFISLWEQYMFHAELMIPKEKLFYVPALCDLKAHSPMGKKHKFPGEPSILIADMWRQDVTPFNTIMAAALYHKKYCPTAKINIIGAMPAKTTIKTLTKMLKQAGALGQVHPLIKDTAKCFRGADMVITPHNISTRIVREALACGRPLVAGTGNPFTKFTADSRDAELFAAEIDRCWKYVQKQGSDVVRCENREVAEKYFHPKLAGEAAKKIYEQVLEDNKIKWKNHGEASVQRKVYKDYGAYLAEQKNKFETRTIGPQYTSYFKSLLVESIEKLPFVTHGTRVLCLGARQGTEVEAFLEAGCFAVGVDLNTGKDNKYVVTGDFHNLQFPDDSVDVVYTNSMDHVYRPLMFMVELRKVLKYGGHFIVHLEEPTEAGTDKWASMHWNKTEELIKLFCDNGFKLVNKSSIDSDWFKEQLVFRMTRKKRWNVINDLIEKNGYKSYLEIGVEEKKTFNRIKCDAKVGIDPDVDCRFRMTSDEFFSQHQSPQFTYDIIYIDGLHTAEQVERDITNSLNSLSENGTIVIHDCNPPSKGFQEFNACGTVWETWAKFRTERADLEMYVVDTDFGLGIIKKGTQTLFPKTDNLTYEFMDENRTELMNVREGDCL